MGRVNRSEENIAYARFFGEAIGFEPKVIEYLDEDESNSIDVISVIDPIDRKVLIHSSIGVSDYPNNIEGADSGVLNMPVELLMVGYKSYDKILDILGEVSLFLIKNNFSCQPGTVFTDMITDFYDSDMKHIMFIEPYLWADKLSKREFGKKKVHCLLLVSISDNELDYRGEYGANALEHLLFADEEIDLYNIKRKSVL